MIDSILKVIRGKVKIQGTDGDTIDSGMSADGNKSLNTISEMISPEDGLDINLLEGAEVGKLRIALNDIYAVLKDIRWELKNINEK